MNRSTDRGVRHAETTGLWIPVSKVAEHSQQSTVAIWQLFRRLHVPMRIGEQGREAFIDSPESPAEHVYEAVMRAWEDADRDRKTSQAAAAQAHEISARVADELKAVRRLARASLAVLVIGIVAVVWLLAPERDVPAAMIALQQDNAKLESRNRALRSELDDARQQIENMLLEAETTAQDNAGADAANNPRSDLSSGWDWRAPARGIGENAYPLDSERHHI